MVTPYRVLLVGMGTIGRKIAEAIIARDNLELIAVVDTNPDLAGKRVDDVLDHVQTSDAKVYPSIGKALRPKRNSDVDVAIVATSSALQDVVPLIERCLEAGANVISICEELSFPYAKHADLAKRLDRAAKQAKRTVVGTGINPGYLMDTLPILLSAPVRDLETIEVTRVIDSSKRRTSFQKKIGTTMTVKRFKEAISTGEITGHVGLFESISMIDSALNLGLTAIEELTPEPVVASTRIETAVGTVQSGEVIGLRSVGVGRRGEDVVVTLNFLAYAGASPEYDEIRIRGIPEITQRIEGGVHGDIGTVAMAINMIPIVVDARPGLKTMKDLPCPHNTERVMKR